jgi:hypothetical protein
VICSLRWPKHVINRNKSFDKSNSVIEASKIMRSLCGNPECHNMQVKDHYFDAFGGLYDGRTKPCRDCESRLQELRREQAPQRRPPPDSRRETPIYYPQPRFAVTHLCGSCGAQEWGLAYANQLSEYFQFQVLEQFQDHGTSWEDCRLCGAEGVIWLRPIDG